MELLDILGKVGCLGVDGNDTDVVVDDDCIGGALFILVSPSIT